MFKHRDIVSSIIIYCLFMTMPLICRADSPADLVVKGNTAYFSGDYDKALSIYIEASINAPESPHLYFNRGAVFYQKGDYSAASEAFEKAARKSKDVLLEAMSNYNLGNCTYREAGRHKESDPNRFLDACIISIQYYQEALQLIPDLTEAGENIEVIRLAMKNILDRINKQEKEAKKQQKAKMQITEELKELIKEQKKALDRNRGLDIEQGSKSESPEMRQQMQELARDQKALQTRTEVLAQDIPKPGEQIAKLSTKIPAEKHLENAAREQNKASKNLEQNSTSEAATNQEKALKELKEALSSLDMSQEKKIAEKIKELIKKQQEALDRNKGVYSERGSKANPLKCFNRCRNLHGIKGNCRH